MKKLIFASSFLFFINLLCGQTKSQDSIQKNQITFAREAFLSAFLVREICSHKEPDTVFIETFGSDTFYTSKVVLDDIIYCDVRTDKGIRYQSIRFGKVYFVFNPKECHGSMWANFEKRTVMWVFTFQGVCIKDSEVRPCESDLFNLKKARNDAECVLLR